MKCECCGKERELRYGCCFECADLESVIAEGTDMYDNPIPETPGLSTYMNKLKYIINKLKQRKND